MATKESEVAGKQWRHRSGERVSALPDSELWELRPTVHAHLSAVRRRYRHVAWALAFVDAACLILALGVSYVARFQLAPLPLEWWLLVATAPFIWVGVFHAFRLYQPQRLSSWEEFRNVISASGVGLVVIAMVSFWSATTFSRAWLGLTWVAAIMLELLARRAAAAKVARMRASGELAFRTLVVGSNREAAEIGRALRVPHLGFNVLGYITVRDVPVSIGATPALGHITQLVDAIRKNQVDCLFVASTAVAPEDMLIVAQVGRQAGVEVRVSANVPQMLTSRVTVQPVGDVMSLAMKPVRLTGVQTVMKRAFDLVVSSLILILAGPTMLVIAALIKLTSRGPVFFRQQRVTRYGQLFWIYKFRTMRGDGDEILDRMGIDPSSPFFKLKDDPRLTKVGGILRKSSLDELPQLLNVIGGSMSLVGPRPLPMDQVEAHLELLMARHEVPAGVTGWWQIQGRSDVTPDEAVRHDLFYIENWSLSLDLYILLKTVLVVVTGRGAL